MTDLELTEELDNIGVVDVNPNKTLVEKALNLDVNYLDNLNDAELTKYIAALSQYNIYISLLYNKNAVLKSRMSRALEVRVYVYCKDNKLKAKTKKDRLLVACMEDDSIAMLAAKLDTIKERLLLLEDLTKNIEQYVNALKKDLIRRRIEFGGYNKS